jgi:hypothetical protein
MTVEQINQDIARIMGQAEFSKRQRPHVKAQSMR